MQRYSLLFGILGILGGIGLLLFLSMSPKEAIAPASIPPEVLIYNIGKEQELPGTSAVLYENDALGIRFGYPASYGHVLVEKREDSVLFSFSKTGDPADPEKKFFMAAPFIKPEGREGYWGDLAWFATVDPRWMEPGADVCPLAKTTASNAPAWATAWLQGATCSTIPLSHRTAAKLTNTWDDFRPKPVQASVYLIPAFGAMDDDGISVDVYAASDERLIGAEDYESPELNIEKLVKSIELKFDGKW